MPKNVKKQIMMYGQVMLGILLCALGYNMFWIPNDLAPGGFTGIAQLINAATGWPVGTVSLCLNVPLFLLSARSLGIDFGVRSLVATVGLSVALDYLPLPVAVEPGSANAQFLACIFGGVLAGAGFGFIIRGNATTGGSDMLARLLHERIPSLSMGSLMFAIDALVVLISAFVFNVVSALYALISVFLCGYVTDMILDGLNAARAYFIISRDSDRIAERVLGELDRGMTIFSARGAYTGEQKDVLLCVVSRNESVPLKQIVAEVDPAAFVIATNAHEALGEGFKPNKLTKKTGGKQNNG